MTQKRPLALVPLFVMVLATMITASPAATIVPYHLQVEYLVDPLGIDSREPQFSWKLKSSEQNAAQSAYQLEVVQLLPTGTSVQVWDTGKRMSQDQAVVYAGKPLEPGKKYGWSLVVWNTTEKNSPSIPSIKANATFSTGLFPTENEPNPWKGKWIGLDTPHTGPLVISLDGAEWIAASAPETPDKKFDLPVGLSLYRKVFDLPIDQKVAKATLAFAADNAHRTFLNGQELEGGSQYKIAAAIDVTKAIQSGKNSLLIEANNLGSTPNPGGCVGVLEIQLVAAEGTKPNVIRILSDASFKTLEPVPQDANLVAWSQSGFDDSTWTAAHVQCKVHEGPWSRVAVGKPEPPSIPARYLTTSFEHGNIKDIARVTASISGLGYYEMFLNGNKIGDHLLDPVLTHYDKRVPYITYDIEPERLKNGTSIDGTTFIGVVLGNGRYYAPRENRPIKTITYGFPKLLFQLDIEYKDGAKKSIVSDETWQITTEGPVRENNDYDGEIYDSRQELKNWPGTSAITRSEEGWRPVTLVEAPKGKLVAQMMHAMKVVETFAPLSITEVKSGVWIFDFGVNLVGNCELKIPAGLQSGQEIKLWHAETLQLDGKDKGMLYVANLRDAKCRDIYTASGKENRGAVYAPQFTYHGFRYAELTGVPEGFKPDTKTLTARAINTDLPRVSTFETSDRTINEVHRNVVRGTQGNYLSVPTDCPQRDERQGWQGDRAGESKGEMFLFDNVSLYTKWLVDIEDSQLEDGNLSDVCPPYWPLYRSNVTWPSAFTIVPDSIQIMYGDKRPIQRHYDAMKRWLINHLGPFVQDGIIAKDNYGDWCVPPEKKTLIHSADPARKTRPDLLATAYYIYNLKLLAEYAMELNRPEDVQELLQKAETMTVAFNAKFYDSATGKYDNGTQTSCVLPLYFGLVPAGEEQKVFGVLVDNIENVTDRHIGTGLIGGQWLNRVLTQYGRPDLSYQFTTNRTYPSWGYMIDNGATTIWELWNGNTADPAMNSGNHVMLVGDLVIWYYENLAGIKSDPARPGFEHIIMKPVIPQGLTFVKARYDSVKGPIGSNWTVQKTATGQAKLVWEIEIPCGATASVYVPTDKPESVTTNIELQKNPDGSYQVPSGKYRFEAEPTLH